MVLSPTMPAAMRKCPVWARRCVSVPDALDSLGNTTAATGGFAIGSAALTGLALLASHIEEIRIGLTRLGTTDISVGGEGIRYGMPLSSISCTITM